MKIRKKESYNYFDSFEKNANYSLQCAKKVYDTINNYDKQNTTTILEEIHEIEHLGDIGKHEMMNYLVKDFLPPIEREDIISLAEKIDDVTDLIEEILINMDVFNVEEIRGEAIEFAKILIECCENEKKLLEEFKNFRKSKNMKDVVIKINDLEEQGDKLYINTMRGLYRKDIDAIEIIKWTTIYNCFENCIDICENLANEVENIVLKNM